MTYFKILQENKVVNVGCVFLKWNSARKKLYICDVDEGQFVQTYDESEIYKDSWMKPAPKEAGEHKNAKVVIISKEEFDELLELLSDGEDIEVEQPEIPVHVVHEAPQEEPEEKPMTISEMRQKIIEQQKQIDALLEAYQSK